MESGAKHPGNASDEATSGGQPIANPDNIFQSTFDYSLIHRLLVPQNTGLINTILANNLPDFDQAFVVVNSPYYGGSGGFYATASTHLSSSELAIHEIGHSFAGLADEYWAGLQYAAEYPNMTQNNNPATIKWKNWLGINNIGIYSYGPSPPQSQWFRPHQSCKMQFLSPPFCSVCTERFIDKIHTLTNMVDTFSPAPTSFTLSSDPSTFSITKIQTVPSTLTVSWYINGNSTPFATGQDMVNISLSSFNEGSNTLRAEIIDNTSLSKSYLPGIGYVNSVTWTLNKSGPLPVQLINFSGKAKDKTGILEWQIDKAEDAKTFDVEKGIDGIHFSRLASVTAQPNRKKYSLNDEKLLAPVTYYRLKVIDKNDVVTYSNIIRLQNAFDKWFYKVYQNAELHKYHLSLSLTDESKHISVKVSNAFGALISFKDFGKVTKQLDYDIDLTGKPAGIYLLNLYVGNLNYTVHLLAK